MRFTRSTDLSLRVLMHLASEPDRLISIGEIAGAQKVSKNHLMKVVNALGVSGLVSTVRGRRGGLRLARPASEIRVGEVVRQCEVQAPLVDCTGCSLARGCRLAGVLGDALGSLYAELDRHTIADLAPRR
jgi:Rrf2 family nitric oxide-sensitive transcriptional repressor